MISVGWKSLIQQWDWVRHKDMGIPIQVITIRGERAECRWKTFDTWRRVWLNLSDLTTKLF